MTRILTGAKFLGAVHACEQTAFRLELQDGCAAPNQDALFAAFLDGDPPSPTSEPELREWYKRVAEHIRQGSASSGSGCSKIRRPATSDRRPDRPGRGSCGRPPG